MKLRLKKKKTKFHDPQGAVAAIESQAAEFEIQEKVLSQQRRDGLQTFEKPGIESSEMKMPTDVTRATAREIGRLHGAYVAWSSYTGYLASLADVDREVYSEALDFVEKRLMLALEDDETVTVLKARVSENPLHLSYRRKWLEANARYKLLSQQHENYLSKERAMSREITRRGNEFEVNTRKEQ